MLTVLASLALLANQPEPSRNANPRADAWVRASVEIVAAEEIRFDPSAGNDRGAKQTLRQRRKRDGMPMVEFY
jgi:hypothetical protein